LSLKTNLGNFLNITDECLPELEQAKDQKTKFILLKDLSVGDKVCLLGFFQEAPTDSKLELFLQSEVMIKDAFDEEGIDMDLVHTREDGFTTVVLLDQSTVIGTFEYVLMEGYLWVESLVVRKDYRNQGIGKTLLGFMKSMSEEVKKPILLFSLLGALRFYLSFGFQLSAKFPYREGHHGLFVTL
jgi:GNAT superfamily N-acetyltransferase